MLTSRELLESSGISRATLNNYIATGLLPKPEVRRQAPEPGRAPVTMGYFPDSAMAQLHNIQQLKRSGASMEAIKAQLSKSVTQEPISSPPVIAPSDVQRSESVQLSIDSVPYVAYMVNYDFQLIWLNSQAQTEFFASEPIPDRSEERSLLPTLLGWIAELPKEEQTCIFHAHLCLIKKRLSKASFQRNLGDLPEHHRQWLLDCYDSCPSQGNRLQRASVCSHPDPDTGACQILAISFREGVLIVHIPLNENADQVLDGLGQRDSVIRTLLSNRLPVLTPLAVIVADLQNSTRICSELPPEEYFQLINEIWSTLDPIFRKYYGAYGKHTGDGLVYYFFPQPDHNYLLNAILCALEVKTTMRKISQAWALNKGWTNQLYMNMGLSEGEEWLGTFKTNTNFELVVLGQTINTGARLSDLARFGKIWATKGLVSKLSSTELSQLRYGVERQTPEGLRFIANTYAQVSSVIDPSDPRGAKLMDIATCAVTEVLALG